MDLTTNYMGLTLRSPIVPSACPLSEDIDNIKRMEDAGAGAVVMHSLFEEQIPKEVLETEQSLNSSFNTPSYTAGLNGFHVTPTEYLLHINKIKQKVRIPIIASLNGWSRDGWTDCAIQIEQAGADGLELNIYYVPTDMSLTGEQVEQSYIELVKAVKSAISIPVAVKLSPYFTNMANMAKRLDDAGADALVLFNRFYQPDINLENLQVEPNILLSTPNSLRLPLRWLAILYGHLGANLAATSGVHTGEDALKLIMAGADVTMVASAILRHGIDYIRTLEQEMIDWAIAHGYESLDAIRGCMSQKNCPNASAFERVQYVKVLQTFKPEWARVCETSNYFG